MTYRIILPITKPELADVCLSSMNEEVRSMVIKVDNTANNIGVSRSWNIGVNYVIDHDIDFLIICSQSMVFNNGMLDLINLLNDGESGKNTKFGWHLIALSRDTIIKCGLFDTNFYPAYYEDSDYIRRLELLKIHEPFGENKLPFADVDAYEQGVALSIKGSNAVKVNYSAVARYFNEKWGDTPSYDSLESRIKLYDHPFNNPELALDYFQNTSIEDLKIKYKL